MLTRYIQAAMHRARYEIIASSTPFYGEIPGFDGVYANADTLEACRDELEGWILLHIADDAPLPIVDGIELKIREVA